MKVKWTTIVLFICFSVNSCFPLCGCDPEPPYTMIDVVVKNSAGEDMLNPATSGFFTLDDIGLYYLNDKKVINVSTDMSVLKGAELSPDVYGNNQYILSIKPNTDVNVNNWATTLLEFKNIRTDTLTCIFSQGTITAININDKTVRFSKTQTYRSIEITASR